MKLLIIINISNVINIIEEPWLDDGPKSILNSRWRVDKILLIIILCLFDSTQNDGTSKIINKIDLNQFIEMLKLAEGSNTENRFLIIIRFYFGF